VRNRGAPQSSSDEAPSVPDQARVRVQLEHMLRSRDFDATDRTRKFLAYVVEETLAGRADRIKAFSIATDVFGRDAAFDAHSDPIIRVEAGHLRRTLEHYYTTAGKTDPVIITVPKGSYVPTFEARQPETVVTPAKHVLSWRRAVPIATAAVVALAIVAWLAVERMPGVRSQNPDIPRLLVKPFDDLTNSQSSQAITRGLTQEIIGQIAKFKDIVTVEGGLDENGSQSMASGGVRYALAGNVNMDGAKIRLQAHVVSLGDGSVIWANSYDGDLRASRVVEIEDEIAGQVATALGPPYGVIFHADASQPPRSAPDDWQAYACTLSYYAYRANLDPKTHPSVRKCLEEAVSRFPAYATAWALLSQTYIDEIRFRFAVDPSSPISSIDRALASARRAIELDPDNIRALEAEMFALYFHGEIEAALKVGERALSINPNDTELVGEYGFRLALSGNWTRGCALLEQVRERNSGPLAYYEAALALCSYFRGDYPEAAMWIKKASATENPNYHVIAAGIFGESGQTADARQERDWLLAHAPKLVANMRSEVAMRFARPEDSERLIGSLRKAGLPIPPD
jgi:TolB-like protein